ncbi:MAG: hypothetical protein NWE79_02105 [Candidatus Bathyarchaeota archaeon]|nr:hypothetical protein [Candidatus Bathyarchaeota archaeon]
MPALEPSYRPLTMLGLLLIVSGVILVALPIVARQLPSLERLPWILVWVYRRDGFYFITSPLLIIVSILSLALQLLGRSA